ncbi:FecR family protein [Sinomicrobium sp.]
MNQDIENSIIRYLSHEATLKDLELLNEWISADENLPIFESYVALHYQTISAVNEPDVDKITKTLLERIKKDRRASVRGRINPYLKYAAIGLLFFGLAYWFKRGDVKEKQGYSLVSEQKEVVIELEDGSVAAVDPDNKGELRDAQGEVIGYQEQSKLIYTHTPVSDKPEYQTIKVPYGQKFNLVLSDSTRVFLNAGTSLRYPVKFVKDSARNVYLTGEAYFEVTEDKKRPFTVSANGVKVQVLGTKFNVSHYPEDEDINTVLVSGSVSLWSTDMGREKAPVLLKPGDKGEWVKDSGEIRVEKVNTELYTAWIKGKLMFRNTSFLKIRRALERRYNTKIVNNNTTLDKQRFDATFDVETIEQVLEAFNRSYDIDYEIKDNKIIIN